jgi:hypothetical protein
MFIYAWGASAAIPWIVPVLGVTVRLLFIVFTPSLLPLLSVFCLVLFSHCVDGMAHKRRQLFMWATFIMYLAVFTYLADCYGPYASSALAGQSLFRAFLPPSIVSRLPPSNQRTPN